MDAMETIRASRGLGAKITRELGLSRGAVSQWPRVPAERVIDVERITGIPREELRPDIYRDERSQTGAAE
jgi:DNA-binding transcriptional regulator YdaS (Cro superfamily)